MSNFRKMGKCSNSAENELRLRTYKKSLVKFGRKTRNFGCVKSQNLRRKQIFDFKQSQKALNRSAQSCSGSFLPENVKIG